MISAPPLLLIVPVGEPAPDGELLLRLRRELGARFDAHCVVGDAFPVLPEWWDEDRGQLSSNAVVDALIESFPHEEDAPPARWVLGVTELDLFAPDRDFVFGEATLEGFWAVIGLARLRRAARPATQRGPDDLLHERVLKEAVHELGHLAGLPHCVRPHCVMFPSQGLEDTDRKPPDLCAACTASVHQRP